MFKSINYITKDYLSYMNRTFSKTLALPLKRHDHMAPSPISKIPADPHCFARKESYSI